MLCFIYTGVLMQRYFCFKTMNGILCTRVKKTGHFHFQMKRGNLNHKINFLYAALRFIDSSIPNQHITLHFGDFDLDSYPDVLMIMIDLTQQDPSSPQAVVLYNRPCR